MPVSKVLKGALKGAVKSSKGFKAKHYDAPFGKMRKSVRQGYMRQALGEGTDSLVLTPVSWLGGEKAKKFLAKNVSMPAVKLDTALGEAANKATAKMTPFKNMFKIKEKVPVSYGKDKTFREVNRSSILAPATKTMGVITPIAAGMAIDEKMEQLSKKNKQAKDMSKSANAQNMIAIEKTAAVKMAQEMIRLRDESYKLAQAKTNLEKKAKAEKLVFKQASLGLIGYPESYEDLQEKVASIANENLEVLEKALELRVGDVSIGDLSENSNIAVPSTPEQQFAEDIIGEINY